jgi:hypothetical protein
MARSRHSLPHSNLNTQSGEANTRPGKGTHFDALDRGLRVDSSQVFDVGEDSVQLCNARLELMPSPDVFSLGGGHCERAQSVDQLGACVVG